MRYVRVERRVGPQSNSSRGRPSAKQSDANSQGESEICVVTGDPSRWLSPSKPSRPGLRFRTKLTRPLPHSPFIRCALTFGLTTDSNRGSVPSHVPVSGSSTAPHASPRTVNRPMTAPVPAGTSSTTDMLSVKVWRPGTTAVQLPLIDFGRGVAWARIPSATAINASAKQMRNVQMKLSPSE